MDTAIEDTAAASWTPTPLWEVIWERYIEVDEIGSDGGGQQTVTGKGTFELTLYRAFPPSEPSRKRVAWDRGDGVSQGTEAWEQTC